MAQGDGKVPILQTAQAGFRFMTSSLPVTFPAGLLVAVFAAAAQILSEPARGGVLGIVFATLALLASVSYSAFLYRLALREDASGFFGLRFGADEGRLIAVLGALVFVFAVMGVVGLLILSFAIAVALMQNGVSPAQLQGDDAAVQAHILKILQSPSGGAFWVLLALLCAVVIWVGVRLSIASAATIGERRIVFFSSFGWTKGNVVHIFLAVLPALAPQLLIALLASEFAAPDLVSAAMRFVLAVIQITLLIPAQAGMYAFLYKGLRPPEAGAPAPG